MKKDGLDPSLFELLYSFPYHSSNFTDYIFSMLGDSNPRVYPAILLLLEKYGPMPISYIGERLSVAKPNMTLIIDNLAAKGWVSRCTSTTDRRVTNIELTESGNEYIKDFTSRMNNILEEKLSVLSPEEKREFAHSLQSLISLADKIMKAGQVTGK